MRVLHTSRLLRLTALVALVLAVAFPNVVFGQSDMVENGIADQGGHKFKPKVSPGSVSRAPAAKPGEIGQTAIAQIVALSRDKAKRTPAQKKIAPHLLHTARMLQGQPAAEGVPYLETGVDLDSHDNLVVDMKAEVSEALIARLKTVGVHIIASLPEYHSIRATIPAAELERIAAWAEVQFIGPKQYATTNSRSFDARFRGRASNVRSRLSEILSGHQTSAVGSQLGEGDVTHKAALARSTFGVTGAGLKIGVLSNGVSTMWRAQELGDLPDVTVIPNQEGDADEGTAMLEIVHDLAPGARLYFATAMSGSESFANNIRALREAGCDIIVDDVSYYLESRFQDGQVGVTPTSGGVVIQAVKDVVADGAIYFSSAANSGNKDADSSGTWEGNFVDGGLPPNGSDLTGAGRLHLFAPGYTYNIVAGAGWIVLTWPDPLGASTNDYDLFVVDPDGTAVISYSAYEQSSDVIADPVEFIIPGDPVEIPDGSLIVVAKYSGADRFLHLSTNRGALYISTEGATYGHNAAADAFGVAAAPANEAFCPEAYCPAGPYPDPFGSTSLLEYFTSDGPRRIFFEGDGTPITPGNFSASGGTALQKPDITAADGVAVTGVGGFGRPFYGTSAAAPHAAAIAGLVWSADPMMSATEVGEAMRDTAIDILTPGWDRNSGDGIVMAYEAVQSLNVPAGANPNIATATAIENPGNGNGHITAGEGAQLTIDLNNAGVVSATGISGTVSALTPGVTIAAPNTVTFSNIPVGGNATSNPLTFTLQSDFDPCATWAEFSLVLTYSGGPSPRTLSFRVPVGQAPIMLNGTLGSVPTPVVNVTTATGMQTGRLYRDGQSSRCGMSKPFPDLGSATGSRAYDSYSFSACRNACATIEVAPTNLNNASRLFSAAYSTPFNGADLSQNYLGDAGASYDRESYGIEVDAAHPYTVVVSEVNPGAAVGQQYNIKIAGCAVNCLTPNRVPIALAHSVTVAAGAGGTANASIDNGSNDPDGDALTITQTPAGPYSIGTTAVLLTVSDPYGATAQASANVTVTAPGPDLVVNKSHVGNFQAGQTGATYNIVVGNSGTVASSGTVTLVDTLPAGLTATALSGPGWTCEVSSLTCTRGDVVEAGETFPSVTLTVNVAENAPATVTNTAVVSGGGDADASNNSDSDPTTILGRDLSITKTHSGNFTAGQTGAQYTITVRNSGDLTNTGTVTVTDTLPATMTATNMAGTGWSCDTPSATCTRSDALAAGENYPAITVTVDTTDSTPASVTNTATVSGGVDRNPANNTASDVTTVTGSLGLGSTAASATVRAGAAASYPIQVAVHGAMGAVNLSCTGLPTASHCTFNPASVTATGEVTLTISTTARGSAALQLPAQSGSNAPYYALLLVPFLGLLGLSKGNRRKLLLQLGGFIVVIVMVMSWAACGGGDGGTPPLRPPVQGTPAGTYTVHVNAAAGGTTATTDVTLIVQ